MITAYNIVTVVAVNKLDTWVQFLAYFLYEMSGLGKYYFEEQQFLQIYFQQLHM
jgi:hypothetical protein